jgi:hypothetical protein
MLFQPDHQKWNELKGASHTPEHFQGRQEDSSPTDS